MSVLSVNLSDELQAVARTRAAERGYASVDAYVASLIEADGAWPVSGELEAEILAGLASPAREVASGDWDEMRRRFRASRSPAGSP
jgi:hypothetical protein